MDAWIEKASQVIKPSINTKDLVERRAKAKADLDLWRNLLETAYKYAVPNYNPFINLGKGGAIAPGQRLNADIFDLTLPVAHNRLLNKLMMGLMPKGQHWLRFVPGLAFGKEGSNGYNQALRITQVITDVFFSYLDRSNFYLAGIESFSDALISTGCLAINPGDRKMPWRFESAPPSHVMLEVDPQGKVCAVFRDWYSVRMDYIKQLWPDATLPRHQKGSEVTDIYECSYIDYTTTKENERYVYVVMTSKEEILFEERSPSWPWVIYRMKRLTGETRGRGPTLEAYPTAATINEAIQDELIAAGFTANPMYMVSSDAAINPDSFVARPGQFIPVRMVMGQWPIQQFPGGGDINFSALIINDMRQQINDLLYTAPLGPISAPDKTATEQEIRYTENLENFMALAPRIQSEFFDPFVKRCFYLMVTLVPDVFQNVDKGILKEMVSMDGQILSLAYETPLMTARGQIKSRAILNYAQVMASLIGAEATIASFKPVELAQKVASYSGISMDVIKTQQEMEAELAQLKAMQQEQLGVMQNENLEGT